MVIKELSYNYIQSFKKCFDVLMLEGYGQFPLDLSKYFLEKDYTFNSFTLWLERNFRKVFIVLNEDDTVIGFLIGDHTYGGMGFISWLGVLKDYRGRGIARELVNKYIEYVKGLEGHAIELYTYENVKPFYLKLGFFEIGRRKEGYFGQKNIIMNYTIKDFNLNNFLNKWK